MNKLLSVTEYSAIKQKDPGNVRRILASGRIQGWKVGNQWVIPSDAEYPEDRRKKTGEYRNWRKRIQLNSNKELMSEIKRMIKKLGVIYGDLLQEVILYGSYARGTQTEESDVDIALLLSRKPASKMTDKMIKCVSEAELNTGKVLSVVDIERDSFDHWKNALPFYRNIQKEGICIWKER